MTMLPNRSRLAPFVMCVCALLSSRGSVSAQPAEGDSSGAMVQGEAQINVRSDVRLSIQGTRGTTSDRMQKFGSIISERMGDLRGCYSKIVAKRPTTVGGLRIEVLHDENNRAPTFNITERDGADAQMTECVRKVLKATSFKELKAPAAAFVTLEFDNTRARGQSMVNQLEAEKAKVDVQTAADGSRFAAWTTDGQEITFTVRGEANVAPELLERMLGSFKQGYAAFLDCRRRSEKGGLSPEGDVTFDVQLQKAGTHTQKVKACTVVHERAPICVENKLKAVDVAAGSKAGRLEAVIHFHAKAQ